MKKRALFLASTALVAAGLTSFSAAAEEPVKLGLGGFYRGAMGAVIGEDSGNGDLGDKRRGHAFKQDIEVYFLGKTTLDNGLTVGARIELEGETHSDQIDAAYAYLEGGFGQVRFGDVAGAATTMCETAPTASAIFGADSPVFNFSNAGTNGTCAGVAFNGDAPGGDKATKIAYFSPDLGGFTFGVSYAPNDAEDNQDMELAGSGTGLTNNDEDQSQIFSVGVNYAREFGEIGMRLGAGWERAFDREREGGAPPTQGIHDAEMWRVHGSASWAGFTLGGAYEARYNNNTLVDDIDTHVWAAGVTYGWDAYSIGLSYSHGIYDVARLGREVDEHTRNIFNITGSYALGPGIGLQGLVGYNDYDNEDFFLHEEDYNAFEVGFGLTIDF